GTVGRGRDRVSALRFPLPLRPMAAGGRARLAGRGRRTAAGTRLRPGERDCSAPAVASVGRARAGCWPGPAERPRRPGRPGTRVVRPIDTADGCRARVREGLPGTTGSGAAVS